MKTAIFGRQFNEGFNDCIYKIFETLNRNNVEIYILENYLKFIEENLFFSPKISGVFSSVNNMPQDIDFMFSIGGDGTMLESVSFAVNANIPVIGINSGRLGFLATVSKDDINQAIEDLLNHNYDIQERAMLELSCNNNVFGDLNFALNEFTIMRVNTSSMISIDVYLNNEFLNTYWSDGLIIATPTGSTAYSLSAGGPIMTPNSGNFCITPVCPHNMSVRPIVISDDNIIRIKANGRERNYLASLDYKQACFDFEQELTLKRSNKNFKIIKLKNNSFYNTLRNKMLWGVDKRN